MEIFKGLLGAVILLAVLGIAGFVYRYEVEQPAGEHPVVLIPVGSSTPAACAQDAKICPDGSAVGRTGPNCSFAACPPPNVELTVGSSTVAFVLPSGYTQSEQGAQNQTTLRIYQKSISGSSDTDALTVSDYLIPAGGSASAVMLANTIFDPSGQQATSTSEFTQIMVGQNTFWVVQIGRFEGQVETAYYLPRTNDVLRFDLVERGVSNWTDPNLDVNTLPEHEAVARMLTTLQVSD